MMNKKIVYRDIEATSKKNREHKGDCVDVKRTRKPKREVEE